MNYYNVVDNIKNACLSHPMVRSFGYGSDILINSEVAVQYAACVLIPEIHTARSNYNTFSFSLCYIDRLRQDRTNKLEVQSDAISVLQEITSKIIAEWMYDMVVGYRYTDQVTVFTDQFSDECAGAYIDIHIDVQSGECEYYNIQEDNDCSENDLNGNFITADEELFITADEKLLTVK